jgi:hypothetical protein
MSTPQIKYTTSRLGGTKHYSIHGTHREALRGSQAPLLKLELHNDSVPTVAVSDENTMAGRQRLRDAIRLLVVDASDMKYLCDLVQEARLRAAL